MTASLVKKIADLETAFWARAEVIQLPIVDEVIAFIQALQPLDTVIYNVWESDHPEAAKIARRLRQIERALPPIHPAFLPYEAEPYRVYQWALYHRADYPRLIERQWTLFLANARSRYDLNEGGLLGVALRLYEKDIQRWTAQRDYIGRSTH